MIMKSFLGAARFAPASRSAPAFRRAWVAVLLLPALLALGACGESSTGPNGDSDPYDHLRAPGASASDFLSDETFERLVVQVQYAEGFRPTAGGLQRIEDFLAARVNKPGGIEIRVDDAPLTVEPREEWSAADVRALEAEHRTLFTEGTMVAAYMVFLDGEYAAGANVLGIAYNNTSMALFAETIRQHSGGALQPSHAVVEGTVANHEIGHILGLVNNGSDMQSPHQDEENGHHCDNDGCLMFWAVRTTDFIANLLGGMPDLDQNCIDDLQANGGR
jgi:predicted Zn-dependent protease